MVEAYKLILEDCIYQSFILLYLYFLQMLADKVEITFMLSFCIFGHAEEDIKSNDFSCIIYLLKMVFLFLSKIV